MQTARFWTGTGMLSGVVIAISLALSPPADEGSGLIQGTVTYQGRPVHCGTIYLMEDGVGLPNAASAPIDENGQYQFDPKWKRPCTGASTYRIVVIMSSDWIPPPTDSQIFMTTGEESWPAPRVVRASLGSPERVAQNPPVGRWQRHRFSSRETTDLLVRLGQEATRLDVALQD